VEKAGILAKLTGGCLGCLIKRGEFAKGADGALAAENIWKRQMNDQIDKQDLVIHFFRAKS
jgi:hypothetical protein